MNPIPFFVNALEQPIVQATVIGVLGLFLQKLATYFVFDRINEFSELRQLAAYRLVFFANVQKGSSNISEAQEDYRALAAKIFGFVHRRDWPLFWLPSRDRLREAAGAMIGLSNSLDSSDFQERRANRRKVIEILTLQIAE